MTALDRMKTSRHQFLRRAATVALAASSYACGGGGENEGSSQQASCKSIFGLVMAGPSGGPCSNCSTENGEAAADGDLYSFATVTIASAGPQQIRVHSSFETYPVGSNVGAFVSLQDNNERVVSLNTYRGGTPVQSVSGTALTTTPTQGGTGATDYISFIATDQFNAVEILLTGTGTATTIDYVYELCADGGVS